MVKATASIDPHVFLSGRPPIAEFITFVKKSAAAAQRAGTEAFDAGLAEEWRKANDHLRTLEASEAGWADSPRVTALPPELHACAEQLLSDPAFRQTHVFVPTEIAMVELDRLVVFQKHINLTQIENIRRELGPDPTPEVIARNALGLSRYSPPVRLIQTHDVFTFTCDSRDFRFLEPILLPAGEPAGGLSRGPGPLRGGGRGLQPQLPQRHPGRPAPDSRQRQPPRLCPARNGHHPCALRHPKDQPARGNRIDRPQGDHPALGPVPEEPAPAAP